MPDDMKGLQVNSLGNSKTGVRGWSGRKHLTRPSDCIFKKAAAVAFLKLVSLVDSCCINWLDGITVFALLDN
jgi:hypothetical protein